MAIIRTKRNYVRVYAAEPEHDLFVETLIVPNDGSNVYRRVWVQPITHWQAAVDWAVGIADQMAHPLVVAAIGGKSFLRLYDERIRSALENLTDQERGEMRQLAISTCAGVMRDCNDQQIRASAYELLIALGVVRR